MARFTIDRYIAAAPEVVFDVITDHRAYPDFTMVRRSRLEKEGVPAPNGVGAVRVMSVVGPAAHEEVLEFERPGLFRYRLLSGLPVRDHVGTVSLSPEGAGTRMSYEIQTTPTLGPLSPLFVRVMKRAIAAVMTSTAAEATRRASA